MELKEFYNRLSEQDRALFMTISDVIHLMDKTVNSTVGDVMGKEGLVFNQDGVFKYGLVKTQKHYTFHSMVMYAFPDTIEEFKAGSKGIKFQKGCFNFSSADRLDLDLFEAFIEKSAEKDFTPIVKKYQAKRK
ncbi:hypothetical protein [Algoriphagus sediminis]|uniref:DUF1801 domain-containing protein n=1 Tax=Algoriphagus sediminis TaxID=3057113 RepID=A0ABT7Y9Y6_9BACT|nr:hypothetical protein [Algoriphagus sediminis]MDN3203343.1 hypothetical protein [Algoriphagus sediminis]